MKEKTIEQYAEEYLKENYSRIGDMHMDKGIKTVFIESAEYQRKKDVERACSLTEELVEGMAKVLINNLNVDLDVQALKTNASNDMRKAMEEE